MITDKELKQMEIMSVVDPFNKTYSMAKELLAAREIKKWAGALSGDLIAGDEEPTHYCSWFALKEALEN